MILKNVNNKCYNVITEIAQNWEVISGALATWFDIFIYCSVITFIK